MLLSVVIPVYNVEKYLDKCVKSVVNQTYNDLEIILVDDGSTDNSGRICDLWAKEDNRIKVLHKKNGGLSSARNAGILISEGELITFVDSDDFIELDMYELMVNEHIKTHKDIVSSGRIVDLWGTRELELYSLDKKEQYSTTEAIREILLWGSIDVSACDKIYNKSLFNDIRYPEGRISEDAAIIFQLVHKSNGIAHVGQPLYHYIYREDSISKSVYTHKKYHAYENCLNTKQFIMNNFPILNEECNIYCTLVCGELMNSLNDNRKLKQEFYSDYKDYRKMFKSGLKSLLLSRRINNKTKIKELLYFFSAFNSAKKLKGFIKK